MTVERPSGPFRIGDRVQLTGPKGRLHTITLREDGELHTHHGVLRAHRADRPARRLGRRQQRRPRVPRAAPAAARLRDVDAARRGDRLPEGCRADPRRRPTCSPGAVVVEAGVGSGALVALAAARDRRRAAGWSRSSAARSSPTSRARTSRRSSAACPRTGTSSSATSSRQLPDAVAPASVDRVVLDMLAPWECIDVVADALTPGGVVLCYVATATQLSRVAEYIRATGLFTEPEASETMVRGWHVEGLAVRPDHRMVAHTGFLLWARRLAPGAVPPEREAPRVEVELRRRGRRAVDARRGRRPSDHRQEPAQAGARGAARRRRRPAAAHGTRDDDRGRESRGAQGRI